MNFVKIIGGLFYFHDCLSSFLMSRMLIVMMIFINANIDINIPIAYNAKNIIVLINAGSFKL